MTLSRTTTTVPFETAWSTLLAHADEHLLVEAVFVATLPDRTTLSTTPTLPGAFVFWDTVLEIRRHIGAPPFSTDALARGQRLWTEVHLRREPDGSALAYGVVHTPLLLRPDTLFLTLSWSPKESAEPT